MGEGISNQYISPFLQYGLETPLSSDQNPKLSVNGQMP